uniref:putative RuBisCO transcriptional regulator n=1 Tax=Phaeostrophion irregulare TaxID=243268 RepID=UPI002E79E94A|nr:putative RuBisCO transcriptional regulator [Phaeostrophion irregulare]WAM64296.1 putative RuBisCO transcriptional regulator [Phaeostrophion irregulare]
MQHFPFSLDQLKILKAIKTEKSFKKAAEKLYLSQPAISLQMQKLEQQIDFPVFDRAKKQTCFTTTGELMLDYAIRILVLCEEADKALLYLKDIKKSRLLIGSSYTPGTYLVPKIIGLFCKRYSYANIKLEVNSTSRTSWGVANGELDIGIVGGEVPNELHGLLQIMPYIEDEIVLILPKSHRLSILKTVAKEDLYKLKFIALKKNSIIRKNIDRILEKNRIESQRLNIHLELNSIEAIKSAVQTGLGVAFISIFALTDEIYLKGINLAKIKDIKVKRIVSIIINRKTCKSKLFEKFNQHIISILKKGKYKAFLKLIY